MQAGVFRDRVYELLKNEGHRGAHRADTVLRRQGALLGMSLMDGWCVVLL